jgi:uncharacterized protein (TIGR00297 family)
MTQIALGAAFAAIVAVAAWRARALTLDGAVAAFLAGAIVFGSGGWRAAAVLFAFFLPSTLFSRVGAARKRALATGEQHGPRNGWQVLANGGVAAACALAASRGGASFAVAFAGAFAAAAADTWGTEIGMLSSASPRSIVTLRPLQPGMSGGITRLGTIATFAGALFVGLIASLVQIAPLVPVALGGVAGALLDSFAGATLQAERWCPACEQACETSRHGCGRQTLLRRGVSWIENDVVNFAATLCGALVAAFAAVPLRS